MVVLAVGGVMPHLTVVIDVPPEIGRARASQRSAGRPDRIEREDQAFFQRVREGYLQLAQASPQRVLLVDGTQTPDVLEARIWAEVQRRLS
jgi:dTMP kinase